MQRTYKALTGIVHAGQGVRAGQRFKADERSRAIRTALAFGLIQRVEPSKHCGSRRMRTD